MKKCPRLPFCTTKKMHPTKWSVPVGQLLFSLGAGLLVEACYSFGYQVDSIPCTTELGSNFWNPTKWLGLLGYQKASLSGGLEYPNFDCNFLFAKCMIRKITNWPPLLTFFDSFDVRIVFARGPKLFSVQTTALNCSQPLCRGREIPRNGTN